MYSEISEAQEFKSDLAFFGSILASLCRRERQRRLLCRRVVVVRGCRLCGTQGRIPSSKCLATAVPTSAHRGWQKECVVLRWWPISLGRQGRESWCVCHGSYSSCYYILSPWSQGESGLRTYTAHTTVTTAEGTMGLMPFKTILNVLRNQICGVFKSEILRSSTSRWKIIKQNEVFCNTKLLLNILPVSSPPPKYTFELDRSVVTIA